MAEANSTPLSEAELEQVRSILQPLSKNPDISEELNPMLSVFRQKMGYGTQMSSHDDDIVEETETTESNSDLEEEEFAESESPQRPPTKIFEDDDIDLDELLAEPGQASEASPSTDDFLLKKNLTQTQAIHLQILEWIPNLPPTHWVMISDSPKLLQQAALMIFLLGKRPQTRPILLPV